MQSMTSFGHMFDDITAKHVYYCGGSGRDVESMCTTVGAGGGMLDEV